MVSRTGNRNDDDKNSFIDDSSGNVARNVTFSGGISAVPSGLRNGLRITTMDVGDTQTALPVSPLSDRNAISIVNLSTTDTLYIGNTGVVADRSIGITAGWEIGPQETYNTDIKDTIIIYGIAAAGKTIRVKIQEIS